MDRIDTTIHKGIWTALQRSVLSGYMVAIIPERLSSKAAGPPWASLAIVAVGNYFPQEIPVIVRSPTGETMEACIITVQLVGVCASVLVKLYVERHAPAHFFALIHIPV